MRIKFNGRKNAVIGLGAQFAFVLLKMMAVAAGVVVFLDVALDIGLALMPDSQD